MASPILGKWFTAFISTWRKRSLKVDSKLLQTNAPAWECWNDEPGSFDVKCSSLDHTICMGSLKKMQHTIPTTSTTSNLFVEIDFHAPNFHPNPSQPTSTAFRNSLTANSRRRSQNRRALKRCAKARATSQLESHVGFDTNVPRKLNTNAVRAMSG